jgi:hypothetical protein
VDKAAIKELLQAYRVGGQDREDSIFHAALKEVARDSELAAWFRQEQEFDALMLKRFAEVPVDTGLRARMLREAQSAIAGATDRVAGGGYPAPTPPTIRV